MFQTPLRFLAGPLAGIKTIMRFLLIILCFCNLSVFGQDKVFNVRTYGSNDTSIYYKIKADLVQQMNLDKLTSINRNWHFRFWTNKQLIEIWEDSLGIKKGQITSWTNEFFQDNHKDSIGKFYFESLPLKNKTINQLYNLVVSKEVAKIKDSYLIDDWVNGNDGYSYHFEFIIKDNYYFNSYWSPSSQVAKESMIITEIADNFLSLSKAKRKWKSFIKSKSFNCYYNGDAYATCKNIRKIKTTR